MKWILRQPISLYIYIKLFNVGKKTDRLLKDFRKEGKKRKEKKKTYVQNVRGIESYLKDNTSWSKLIHLRLESNENWR